MQNSIFQKILSQEKLSVALVGASNNPKKYGHRIYQFLKSYGVTVFPINPHCEFVEGQKTFGSLSELTLKPDVINFVVPPQNGIEVVREALSLNLDYFFFQPGAESAEIRETLKAQAKNYIEACIMVELRKLR